jgi:hypothetical protein
MNDENNQGSVLVNGDSTGTLGNAGHNVDAGASGDEVVESANVAEAVAELQAADSRLKLGVPVEDIGVTQEQAALLGLLKSEEDYKAEEAAKIAALESLPHQDMIIEATDSLVGNVRNTLKAAITLGDVTNQVYGKFMTLSMAQQAEALRNLNTNIHFNKIIELLEQVKAHSVLLEVEMCNSVLTDSPDDYPSDRTAESFCS